MIKLSLARCDDLSEKSLSQFLSFFLKVKDDAVLLDYVNRLDTYTIAKEKAIRFVGVSLFLKLFGELTIFCVEQKKRIKEVSEKAGE